MGLFRSKGGGDGGVDFSPLLSMSGGVEGVLEDVDRAAVDMARIQVIGGFLDPATEPNAYSRCVPDGATVEDIMELANQCPDGWVMRDVVALWNIPAIAPRFADIRRVLVMKGADDYLTENGPHPPYFTSGARKKMRRVEQMAALGYYWGWDESGEGWYHRGPGNPGVHDIRGPKDVSQYNQLCPIVRWR